MSDPVTAPDLVSIIAAAIASHVEEVDYIGGTGWCVCNQKFATAEEHAAHQARAVLAAISEAGQVEWGLFRKTDPLDALAFEGRNQFPTKEDAQKYITHGFLPHMHNILEPRSRITGPWERAE